MEIGNDDLDFYENEDVIIENDDTTTQDITDLNTSSDGYSDDNLTNEEEDFVSFLLRERGIEDKSKIKFQDDEGTIEELSWDNLSNLDRLNILNSTLDSPDLDDAEIQLLNTIRSSQMTPAEYLQYVEKQGVDRYIQNSQPQRYSIDNYTDDELFIFDLISRAKDLTDDEVQDALERAKSNEAVFSKLMEAIRKEYKLYEEDSLKNQLLEQEQIAREEYNRFSLSIVQEINQFKDIAGYDLNMDSDDMQMLYDFITGYDKAGNNHFAKALADPKTVVKVAWLALNADQMINDITDYFLKEITNVRRNSLNKEKKDKSNVVYKNKQTKSQTDSYSDLDDF